MINSIKLRNFKCFENSDLITLNKINVLTGYNGAGKSSVFQSILLLAQSVINNEITDIRANGKYIKLGSVADLVYNRVENNRLTISINNSSPDYSLDFTFAPNKKNDRLGKLTDFILNGQDQFAGSGKIGNADSVADEVAARQETEVGRVLQCADWGFLNIFRNIHYISAGRLGPTLYEERTEIDSENPIGERGEHRLEVLRSKPDIVNNIESELAFIMESDISIKLGDAEESHSVLNLSFKNDKTCEVKSVNTGFGFSYILPLLMAMECQDGKIFIENPEAHLHPRAQSRLIQVLVKRAIENNNQLFVETHSEHIINGLRLSCLLEDNPVTTKEVNIYFFDSNKKIVPLELDVNVQLSPWPEGFFDQQQKDSSEILRRGLLK